MDNSAQDIDTIAEEKVADFLSRVAAVRESLHKVIVAQDEALDLLLSAPSPATTRCCSACRGWPRR